MRALGDVGVSGSHGGRAAPAGSPHAVFFLFAYEYSDIHAPKKDVLGGSVCVRCYTHGVCRSRASYLRSHKVPAVRRGAAPVLAAPDTESGRAHTSTRGTPFTCNC